MKRIGMLVALVAMCGMSLGQDKPATQTAPAGQAAAAPQGKRPPKVNSQEEYAAYKTAVVITDPAAAEKAADEFATKYPDSELRVLLYREGPLRNYQRVNNEDKTLEMARKVLAIDPDDPEALLAVSQILLNQTHDADLDKDQKIAEAKKCAERVLVTVDTDVPTSSYTPEQLAQFKGYARSEAYEFLGTIAFNAKNWAEAEANMKKSIDAYPSQPDPIAVYRLAVALDMQNRIPEAMKIVQQAIDLTKDHPDSSVGKAARQEQDRLTQLNGGTPPGQSAPPQKN